MKFPTMITADSVTVIIDGKPHVIRTGNSNFELVRQELQKKDDACIQRLKTLLDVERAVEAFTEGNIEVKAGQVLFRGRVQHNVVVDRILAAMKEGLDHMPLVRFMDRLLKNPSARSVEELYRFLEHGFMPITPEGFFQAYKGLDGKDYSVFGDPNAPLLQGTMDSGGHIHHQVGATIEVERNYVIDDFHQGCARGLHAGSYEYARDWARSQNLVVVEIDPADVVSVPNCSDFQKLRTCKYRIVQKLDDFGPLENTYSQSSAKEREEVECEFCGDDPDLCDCNEVECEKCGYVGDPEDFHLDYEDVCGKLTCYSCKHEEEYGDDYDLHSDLFDWIGRTPVVDAGPVADSVKAPVVKKKKIKRDANGRFAAKYVPKRDAKGRFA